MVFIFVIDGLDLSLPVVPYAQFTPIEPNEYAAIIFQNEYPRLSYSLMQDLCVKIESENKFLFQLSPEQTQVAGLSIVITIWFLGVFKSWIKTIEMNHKQPVILKDRNIYALNWNGPEQCFDDVFRRHFIDPYYAHKFIQRRA